MAPRCKPTVAFLIALTGCGTNSPSHIQLTGGTVVTDETRFPATIHFVVKARPGSAKPISCTGIKLTARQFLTAAHCVFNLSNKTHTLNPGYEIWLYKVNDVSRSNFGENAWTFVVEAVDAHRNYKEKGDVAYDLAVVTLAADIRDVPRGVLATSAPRPGARVVKVGYGCENGHGRPSPHAPRLKSSTERLIAPDDFPAIYRKAGVRLPDAAARRRFLSVGMFTPALLGGGPSALCSGDSGGPLYLESDGVTVVGINSSGWDQVGDRTVVDYHTSVLADPDWLKGLLRL